MMIVMMINDEGFDDEGDNELVILYDHDAIEQI